MSALTASGSPFAAAHRRRYQKAKALAWDPAAFDLEQDKADWAAFSDEERDAALRACALFLGGEEAVAGDLAPLMVALRKRPGNEAACAFLASQLWEEAKHAEFFERWITEVAGAPDLAPYASEPHAALFEQRLPEALDRLLTDRSDEALVRAVATYHVLIEGTLAEAGYHGFYTCFKENDVLPGLVAGIEHVQRDEARHIAFGLDLLRERFAENPALAGILEEEAEAIFDLVVGILADYFAPYGGAENPFGLRADDIMLFAGNQLGKRMAVLERA
jgi:ribonucleoside-diphosphate reductase beta chain